MFKLIVFTLFMGLNASAWEYETTLSNQRERVEAQDYNNAQRDRPSVNSVTGREETCRAFVQCDSFHNCRTVRVCQ